MKTSNFQKLFIFLLFITLFACNNGVVYKKDVKIPSSIWNMDNIIKFDTQIDDINIPYNLFLSIRHTQHYPARNLWLFITITSPEGNMQKDTFECMLADKKYKWVGKGMGDIYDAKILYHDTITFPSHGEYTFEIQQGMRMKDLPHIMEVGLIIEKLSVE